MEDGPVRLTHAPVLVLNHNYEPLHVCNARRAVVLVSRGKAEVLEEGAGAFHTVAMVYPFPSVIRLVYIIHRPRPQVRLNRREVFARDDFTCQYCGHRVRDLTLDHVTPRRLGGGHSWENLVSACKTCNHRKAGRTPAEARMRLLRPPRPPQSTYVFLFHDYLPRHQEWLKFIPGSERLAAPTWFYGDGEEPA
ncbi:MAG TPA: HNH endonuclease [Dehalococcoidia bacterium]|nr:HNH endonuclease [Dehalococcoidia bacterium]